MSSSARKLAFADPPSPSHGLAPIEADDGQSVATSMSAMDVDEEYDDDDDGDDDDEEDYYDDTVSTYARSHYPNMTFADAPIEVDGADQAASTRSLLIPDLGYIDLHDRRYCQSYFMPNDEHELARMTLLQQVHLSALDGALTTVPLDKPTKVLDIGTGTGEWAIRMGELYRDCEVVGTDISAIQETSVPPNVFFEIDDAEDAWERPPNSVDLVHMRHMDGAFRDVDFVYRQALETLKPGGWLEQKEWCSTSGGFMPPEGEPSPSPTLETLVAHAVEAADIAGRPWFRHSTDPQMLINAGFVDVCVVDHAFPIRCDGPRGNAGKMWLITTLEGLEAFFLRLLTEQLSMDPEEVRNMCARAADELVALARDPTWSQNACVKIAVLKGRKPFPHEVSSSSARSNGTVPSSPTSSRRAASLDGPGGNGVGHGGGAARPLSASMASPPTSPKRVRRRSRKSIGKVPADEPLTDVTLPGGISISEGVTTLPGGVTVAPFAPSSPAAAAKTSAATDAVSPTAEGSAAAPNGAIDSTAGPAATPSAAGAAPSPLESAQA